MLQRLFKTKDLDRIMRDADEAEFKLKRALGSLDLIALGIGAIIGSGIFATVGTAVAGDAVRAEESLFLRRRRRHLVVRVDRTDLSKNILRGFHAYERLLERRGLKLIPEATHGVSIALTERSDLPPASPLLSCSEMASISSLDHVVIRSPNIARISAIACVALFLPLGLSMVTEPSRYRGKWDGQSGTLRQPHSGSRGPVDRL